jgi:hypothetical protein
MIIREKIIFWVLLPILFVTIIVGFKLQEKKRQSSDEFLRDIESVTEKAKAKKKTAADIRDIDGLKEQEASEEYSFLVERGIFLKPVSEVKDDKKTDIMPLKEEELKKPAFIYKGRMTLGDKVIVIIGDENTGKSFSVKEGDTADDFTVLSIDEKEIRIRKKDGEEVVIATVKEEKKKEIKAGSETLFGDNKPEGSK